MCGQEQWRNLKRSPPSVRHLPTLASRIFAPFLPGVIFAREAKKFGSKFSLGWLVGWLVGGHAVFLSRGSRRSQVRLRRHAQSDSKSTTHNPLARKMRHQVIVSLLATIGSARALLDEYARYKNETLTFHTAISASDTRDRHAGRIVAGVNRRGGIEHDEALGERVDAVLHGLGVRLELARARAMFTANYKELVVNGDGTAIVTREGPPPCMYHAASEARLSRPWRTWVREFEAARATRLPDAPRSGKRNVLSVGTKGRSTT